MNRPPFQDFCPKGCRLKKQSHCLRKVSQLQSKPGMNSGQQWKGAQVIITTSLWLQRPLEATVHILRMVPNIGFVTIIDLKIFPTKLIEFLVSLIPAFLLFQWELWTERNYREVEGFSSAQIASSCGSRARFACIWDHSKQTGGSGMLIFLTIWYLKNFWNLIPYKFEDQVVDLMILLDSITEQNQ